jgi:hypothetical protein
MRSRSRSAVAVALLAGVVAAGALVVAPSLHAEHLRRMPLRGLPKLTSGPLLGLASGAPATSAERLTRIDSGTLRPSGSRSLRLPFLDAWAVAPGGRMLALAVHPDPTSEPNTLKLVRLPSLRVQGASLPLAGDVSALAWTSPSRVVALVGAFVCCPAPLSVVVADVRSKRVLRRSQIPGTVLHIARSSRGLVLLTAASGTIGPASLVIADARGLRSTSLAPMRAGEIPGGGGTSRWRLPGLAVDAAADSAYVIDPDGAAAEIDLATLTVYRHQLTREHSLLARLDDWLEPSADAKGDSGPIRNAQWLGNGLLLVAGSNLHDTRRSLASDPSGLELVDTRRWTVRTLDPRADSFAVADGLLLATGTRWHGNTNPTGMGLVAYGRDGNRRFALLAGQAVWLDTTPAIDARAEIGVYGRTRWFVVDLRTGQIAGTSTALPTPLLGRGNPLG